MRTGQAAVGQLSEELVKIFSEGVGAITAGTAMALATTYDFSQHQPVLDLGGGTGSFLLAVLRNYSHLETSLFEQPEVAAVARQHLVGTPVAGQVKIVVGDFFKDTDLEKTLYRRCEKGKRWLPTRIHDTYRRVSHVNRRQRATESPFL